MWLVNVDRYHFNLSSEYRTTIGTLGKNESHRNKTCISPFQAKSSPTKKPKNEARNTTPKAELTSLTWTSTVETIFTQSTPLITAMWHISSITLVIQICPYSVFGSIVWIPICPGCVSSPGGIS